MDGFLLACPLSLFSSWQMVSLLIKNFHPEFETGDPLSPFLFIICDEGLFAMLRQAEMNLNLYSLPFGRTGLRVSHLFFIDDRLLFSQASFVVANVLLQILSRHELNLGQSINFQKSSIFFSYEVPHPLRH